jgi:hypothetical protein
MAGVLTIFLIVDLAAIDENSKTTFEGFPESDRIDFNGIQYAFRTKPATEATDRFAAWR